VCVCGVCVCVCGERVCVCVWEGVCVCVCVFMCVCVCVCCVVWCVCVGCVCVVCVVWCVCVYVCVCVCVCVVTRTAVRHDSTKSRREIESPVKCAIQVNSSLVTFISEASCHAVVTQTDRQTDRQEGIFAFKRASIRQGHGQH